ncbi:GntR family transcriptional regulator [Streptomyces tanashiensis]|uniref:GntR family transcriptional regulator n=1 Tax=Streptomyces tanashiensis TaxID=67367 RepID=UPI003441B7E1
MLTQDIDRLRSVKGRRTGVPTEAVEDTYHLVHASTQPWLRLARSRHAASDSKADRARWEAWIAALTPPPHGIRGTWSQACLLADAGGEMLRALSETLVPCPSVGTVAQEIQRRIEHGILTPSTRIRRRTLVKALRVPTSYVDLALADLAATGLVEARAGRRAPAPCAGGRVTATGRRQGLAIGATGVGAA